ncbi:DNA polymerase III subunit beta [Streptomyces sp. NPDC001652]|uniref:DNA polymerase III subunit beta n=1 Tax=Streptomyces sp. NPDC001652 TaxID=3154393 RepID=UPI003323EB8A
MKIRIEQRLLADAARQAQRRLPNNPLQPVLAGLLLEAAEGGPVHLSGFDLETATRATLDAEVIAAGDVVVSARLLADVTASLPAGFVDLVVDEHQVTVSTPGSEFQLPVMPRAEYPALPAPPGAAGVVDGSLFAAAVGHAAQSAKPAAEATGNLEGLGGVDVAADGAQLTVSASDRYRIVRHFLPWQPDGDGHGHILIPAAEFAATAKAMADGDVRVSFPDSGGGVAALATAHLTVTGRTIATPFPNIDPLFPDPDKATGSAVFDAEGLSAAAKRAGLVGDDKTPIKLAVDGDKAVLYGGVSGTSGRSEIGAESDLDGFSIAFNPGFLASLLAPINGQVRMWFTTPTKPALIEPVDDNTYRAVCMPVRL